MIKISNSLKEHEALVVSCEKLERRNYNHEDSNNVTNDLDGLEEDN